MKSFISVSLPFNLSSNQFLIVLVSPYLLAHSSTYIKENVKLPCGSKSINRTFFPSLANLAAILATNVVFPTPPL